MANPVVTIEMAAGGKIVAELYPETAPQSVRRPWGHKESDTTEQLN